MMVTMREIRGTTEGENKGCVVLAIFDISVSSAKKSHQHYHNPTTRERIAYSSPNTIWILE